MTTELPYTDTDLRAEAASQYAGLTEDPDFMGVGEAMQDRLVPSTAVEPDSDDTGSTWEELLPYDSGYGENEAYNAAQRKIHDFIRGAADVSEWAVDLGADGLEPSTDQVTVNGDDRPIVRVHFAFDPAMPTAARSAVVAGLGQALADLL